eukprot:2946142-Amphidinium_carterae.1
MAQAEWGLVVQSHEQKLAYLEKMLADVEEAIESVPFRRCEQFEQYLDDKHLKIRGGEVLDEYRATSM